MEGGFVVTCLSKWRSVAIVTIASPAIVSRKAYSFERSTVAVFSLEGVEDE